MAKIINFSNQRIQDAYLNLSDHSDYRPGESGKIIGVKFVNNILCFEVQFECLCLGYISIESVLGENHANRH